MRATIVAISCFLCAVCALTGIGEATVYQVTNLGAGVSPAGINDAGQVVGQASSKPFLYLPSPAYGLPAGMNDLSLSPGYAGSGARDINNLGQISGISTLSSGFLVASIWLPTPAYSRS